MIHPHARRLSAAGVSYASEEDIESLADAGNTVIAEYEGEPEAGAVALKVRAA